MRELQPDWSAAIDISPVPDLYNKDQKLPVGDLVEYPVVTDADAVTALAPLQLLRAWGPWLVREAINEGNEDAAHFRVQFLQFPRSGGVNRNGVAHGVFPLAGFSGP